MTTKNNSFRLQRLTKTMGVREHSISQYEPKQTFKLAALNSINLGVKYNDLSYISGRDLNKLRKEPEISDDLQYESAHQNLSSVRKNYDSMHKQKESRDNSIIKLKEQRHKLNIIESQLLENKEKGRKKVSVLENKLQNVKMLFTETDMQKKVLFSMRDRLKHDKVIYDQRKFNSNKELRFLQKQKEVIVVDKTEISVSDDRTNKIYKKYLAQLNEEQTERENHIKSLENMVEEKQKIGQISLNRSQQMHDIAERAMQDKDQNEKNWQKLYLTNKLVSRLLREKMDKQMNKFFIVQSAFKTIKIATGVNDSDTLVKKFLNKQSTYGDLLGKIAENQRRTSELKQQSDQLIRQFKELQNERQIIDHTKIAQVKTDKQMKILIQTEKKQEKCVLQKQKMRTWTVKTVKKMNHFLKNKQELSSQRNLKNVGSNFIAYIKCISEQLEQIQKEDKKPEEIFSATEKIKNQKRLTRIKQRKDSKVIDDESQDEGNANNDQGDLVLGQRLEIHRINEKFMKQAKKRSQELRKVKAEQISPKKKDPEVKPKKVEEVQ